MLRSNTCKHKKKRKPKPFLMPILRSRRWFTSSLLTGYVAVCYRCGHWCGNWPITTSWQRCKGLTCCCFCCRRHLPNCDQKHRDAHGPFNSDWCVSLTHPGDRKQDRKREQKLNQTAVQVVFRLSTRHVQSSPDPTHPFQGPVDRSFTGDGDPPPHYHSTSTAR